MENNPTYLFVVAAALLDSEGKVLVQKRPIGKPMAGLWEFPGGKVEFSELPEAALVRELKEELGIDIDLHDLSPLTFASEELEAKHLLLLLYVCNKWAGQIQNHEATAIQWLEPGQLTGLEMPPADIPLVQRLIEFTKRD